MQINPLEDEHEPDEFLLFLEQNITLDLSPAAVDHHLREENPKQDVILDNNIALTWIDSDYYQTTIRSEFALAEEAQITLNLEKKRGR